MILKRLFQLREGDVPKPFLDHLEDLRWTLVKMAAALLVGMIVSFSFRHQLVRVLQEPLYNLDPSLPGSLVTLGVADSITISLKLSFYAGIVLSFPLLLFFLAEFVLPALTKQEKKHVLPAIAVGFALFLMGVCFAYYWVVPSTLKWLFQDTVEMGFRPTWTAIQYFSFITQLTIAFGMASELPVAVLALVHTRLLTFDFLSRTRSYAIVVLLFLAMIIAPTPDPMTFLSLGLPMVALYECCIWLAWLMEWRRRRAE